MARHVAKQAHGAEDIAPSQRWMSLVAAVERLAATQTLDEVIAIVRETARAISGADGVSFVLRDNDLCHYVEESAIAPLWKGKRFPLSACISGWCMLNDEKAVIADIYADARIPHDAYRPTFVKSLVMVPVRTTEPFAAIGSYWAEQREFGEDELALLEALARSTSAAVSAVQARGALRESEDRLSMALTAGGLGAWELNFASAALTASPLCQSNFGLAGSPFPYDALVRTVHPEDRAGFESAIREARAWHSSIAVEFRAVWPNGEVHWIEMRGRVVLDANGEPARMTGVTLDVTERRQAKERLDRMQSELAHVGRLNEMGQMASTLAHELNQPLTAANNYLGAARRFLESENMSVERALAMAAKADGQFQRASQIIGRIRGFVGKKESVRGDEPVVQTIEEAMELALVDPRHRGIEVRVGADAGLPPVHIDKVQIQQVLLNLLRNAFEAMESSERRQVTVSAALSDGRIVISVADTGPGLAPDVAARLFQPFVTSKANGMGIGLSMCRSIVEAHGGEMSGGPGKDGGAEFRFSVPSAKAD